MIPLREFDFFLDIFVGHFLVVEIFSINFLIESTSSTFNPDISI